MCERKWGWDGKELSGGWEGVDGGLKSGIRCGGRSIVCKGNLGTEKSGERGGARCKERVVSRGDRMDLRRSRKVWTAAMASEICVLRMWQCWQR